MRRALPLLLAVAVLAVVVVGLTQAGPDEDTKGAAPPFELDRALASLGGAPAPLGRLHDQANELLGGGVSAMKSRLRELRGHPVVLNKWASWCGPCRHEFPFFQRVAATTGKRVAFLGLNSGDSRAAAREFLAEFPVTYPSYEDPDEKVARAVGAPANYPITVFIDERGRQAFIRQGGYASEAQLQADIDRYLGA